jgi:hypothetical protein
LPSNPALPEDSEEIGNPGAGRYGGQDALRDAIVSGVASRPEDADVLRCQEISQMAYKATGTARGRESVGNRNTKPGKAEDTSGNCVGAGCRIGGGPEALFEA